MKRILMTITMMAMCSILMSESGFRDYLTYNIGHFQKAENLSYSLKLDLYKDSLSNQLSQADYMHVYTGTSKQCVYTDSRVMIKENNRLVSILRDERSVVLQESAEAFGADYVDQLMILLSAWETLNIESRDGRNSEVIFKVRMPSGSDYSAIELTFNKKSRLLTKSTIWLKGQYTMGDNTYTAPRIEMGITKLMKPQISRYSIRDVLTDDLELTEEYKDYVFYNTIEK